MKTIFSLLLTTTLFYSCNKSQEANNKLDSVKVATTDVEPKIIFSEEDKKELASIEKNFLINKDEFNNTGWLHHKSWGKNFLNRKALTATVREDGYCYLESNYFADDWLFHTKVQVKIGDQVYETSDVPTFDKSNKRDNEGGEVWECISFIDGKDNGILNAIAENKDKEIKVRFVGKQYYDDITLSKKDKSAIADCVKLASLLKKKAG